MKKAVSATLILSMLLLALLLSACGGKGSQDLTDSKYVGTWKATTLALKDESGDLDTEWILTLNGGRDRRDR